MNYPRKKEREIIGRKIFKEDIPKILELRSFGYTYQAIADLYGVAQNTIYRAVNEDYRKQQIKKSVEWNRKKLQDNPDYRKRVNALSTKNRAERYKSDDKYRDYIKRLSKRRYDNSKLIEYYI